MVQGTAMSANNGSDAQFILLYMGAMRIVWRYFVPLYTDASGILQRG